MRLSKKGDLPNENNNHEQRHCQIIIRNSRTMSHANSNYNEVRELKKTFHQMNTRFSEPCELQLHLSMSTSNSMSRENIKYN